MANEQQLFPETKSRNGMKAYQAGDYLSAIIYFTGAISEFKDMGDTLSAAEAANNLSICYLKSGDSQKALDVIEGTDELFKNTGDKCRQAIALGNQGAALEGLGQLEQAIIKYELCSSLLKETGNHDYRAIVLKSLSTLHMKMGHQLDALGTMQVAMLNDQKPSFKNWLLKKLLKIPFGS